MSHQFEACPDAARIEVSAKRRNILGLFHYTTVAGLRSVLTAGAVLSRNELEARGISYSGHGYGHPGKETELGDYVFCGLIPPWGMMKDETEPMVIIEFQSRLLWSNGKIFCPNNSAYNQFSLADLLASTTLESFDGMFANLFAYWPVNNMAEVMLHRMVPVCEVRTLHFLKQDDLDSARRLCRGVIIPETVAPKTPLKVAISPQRFPPQFR